MTEDQMQAKLRAYLIKRASNRQQHGAAIAERAFDHLEEAAERKARGRTAGAVNAALCQAVGYQQYAAELHEEAAMFLFALARLGTDPRGTWEAGMRDAARIAERRFEDDPEYRVYPDGEDIGREIRDAIRERRESSI